MTFAAEMDEKRKPHVLRSIVKYLTDCLWSENGTIELNQTLQDMDPDIAVQKITPGATKVFLQANCLYGPTLRLVMSAECPIKIARFFDDGPNADYSFDEEEKEVDTSLKGWIELNDITVLETI